MHCVSLPRQHLLHQISASFVSFAANEEERSLPGMH